MKKDQDDKEERLRSEVAQQVKEVKERYNH